MLKKTITYEDYNGNKVVEDFYFNLNKAELIELEVSEKGGWVKFIQEVVVAEDAATLIALFKKIILMSYGQKSADGREFEKSDEIRRKFSQTEAYSDLFMELATDDKAAAAFMNGIVPASLQKEVESAHKKIVVVEQKEGSIQKAAPIQEKVAFTGPAQDLRDLSKEELLAMLKEKTG